MGDAMFQYCLHRRALHRAARMSARRIITALVAALMACQSAHSLMADTVPPALNTNQHIIERLKAPSSFNITDPLSVFAFVLANLPPRAKIYPTENYYYFSFSHDGLVYAGNIRLDASDRDAGFLHFAYFEEYAAWREPDVPIYRKLGAADGVTIRKIGKWLYDVTFGGKSVLFEINDLSGVAPPAKVLGPGEIHIGPIFDESGLQFYLVFNSALKVFHYILNETGTVPEKFDRIGLSERISVGRRTSFAFYDDDKLPRKILIGVYEGNTFLNNAYDGPFDQLPDNTLEGNVLRDAIASIVPDYADKIDRFGSLPDGSERFAITPYIYYAGFDDLKIFLDCLSDSARPEAAYHGCFDAERLTPPDKADTPPPQ